MMQNPREFYLQFMQMVNHVLGVFKREPAVERVVKFVRDFVCSLPADSEDAELFVVRAVSRGRVPPSL